MPIGSSLEWQDYIDVADDVLPWMGRDWSTIVGGESGYLGQNLALITSMCCDWVQETLGRPIAPTVFTRRFDGWSGWQGAYLELPYYPVLQIASVTEYRGASGAYVLQESTPTNQVDGYQLSRQQGRLTRIFPGNMQKPWFPGSRNVEVTWTAGYNPIPPRLKVGTLEMVKFWWKTRFEEAATRGGGGGESYDGPMSSGMLAGTPDVILDTLFPTEQIGIG